MRRAANKSNRGTRSEAELWRVLHVLISRGHGTLTYLLGNYTLHQAERFVHEIHADELLARINLVRDVRLSQASNEKSSKGQTFQSLFNQMLRSYRQMVNAGPARTLPSPQEQALLDKQQHYDFNELSQQEQMRLRGELDSMWGQIPAHLQKKARDLAGVS